MPELAQTIPLACTCGMKLRIAVTSRHKRVVCPRCRSRVFVPVPDECELDPEASEGLLTESDFETPIPETVHQDSRAGFFLQVIGATLAGLSIAAFRKVTRFVVATANAIVRFFTLSHWARAFLTLALVWTALCALMVVLTAAGASFVAGTAIAKGEPTVATGFMTAASIGAALLFARSILDIWAVPTVTLCVLAMACKQQAKE